EAQIGHILLARITRGLDFAFNAPLAKSARHKDAAQSFEKFYGSVAFEIFGIDFLDLDAAIVGDGAVDNRLINRFISILKLDVFADNTNADAMLRRDQFANDFLPMIHA